MIQLMRCVLRDWYAIEALDTIADVEHLVRVPTSAEQARWAVAYPVIATSSQRMGRLPPDDGYSAWCKRTGRALYLIWNT